MFDKVSQNSLKIPVVESIFDKVAGIQASENRKVFKSGLVIV